MRIAVLYEDGQEIWRGKPAHMPIRFIKSEEYETLSDETCDTEVVNWTMAMVQDTLFPPDDANILPEDLY